MLKIIIIALSIMLEVYSTTIADEQNIPVVMSVDQLCSKTSPNNGFAELKGTELILSGSLSSIGNKRKAFLGNNINFIAELVISPAPKKDAYGVAVPQTGCTVTCLL